MIRVSDARLTLEYPLFIEFNGKFTRTGRDVLVRGFVGGQGQRQEWGENLMMILTLEVLARSKVFGVAVVVLGQIPVLYSQMHDICEHNCYCIRAKNRPEPHDFGSM